ncbi:MAG: glycosyltransferase family 2 protein [Acidobacteriota bacterium]
MPGLISPRDLPPPPDGMTGWPWTCDELPHVARTLPDGSPWPLVSVITPSYNHAHFLEEAIRSVLLQGYPNLEYIVIDGGSSDGSVDLIRKYEPWITSWVSERDEGHVHAINKGFWRSTGDFLAWINADDLLYPGFLIQRVTQFHERPDVALVYGDVETAWDRDPRRWQRKGRAITLREMVRTAATPMPQQACMWRRRVFDKIGWLDQKWKTIMDREFLLRTCMHFKAEYIPGKVGLFRFHGGSKSVSISHVWLDEVPALYTEIFDRPYFPEELKPLRKESLSSAYIFSARTAYGTGARRLAYGFTLRAIRAYPKLLLRRNEIYIGLWKCIRRLLRIS